MKRQEEYFNGENNIEIHYKKYEVKKEKAKIVISHGFCESLVRYRELIKIFNQEGYSVYIVDHRGHGYSGRLGIDDSQINVEKFDYYVEDFKTFIDTIVKPDESKLFLFAHSMGGCIGGLFLERYPNYFDAAILNAPMMQIDTGKYPDLVSKIIANAMCAFGQGKKYILGHNPFDGKPDLIGSGTSSQKRYDVYFNKQFKDKNLQTAGGSFNWLKESFKATKEVVKNSNKIQVPVLLIQAGKDTFVKPGGHNKFVQGNSKCELYHIEKAKHEIYIEKDEIVTPYISKVLEFYTSNLMTYSTNK
jgi:lysophospholipase